MPLLPPNSLLALHASLMATLAGLPMPAAMKHRHRPPFFPNTGVPQGYEIMWQVKQTGSGVNSGSSMVQDMRGLQVKPQDAVSSESMVQGMRSL